MKAESPMASKKPDSTAYINIQGKKGLAPKIMVGQSVEATVRGTVRRVSLDEDGYSCDLNVKSVDFAKASTTSMGDQLKRLKGGRYSKAEETAEGE